MRITYPYETDRLGAVRIFGVQHIFELDSGPADGIEGTRQQIGSTVAHVPPGPILEVQRRMAVVVPCRDERLKVLEGVLSGIPHECLVILVSNSSRDPVDRFMMERDSMARFCRFAERDAVIVHQRDPGVGRAFAAAGLPELAGDAGLVPHGKGEGMIIGIALARLAGKRFVGFVDADNYVPGAVHEYVRSYAADFHLARSRFSMVRINWHSKPKIVDGRLFFSRSGRVSEITNRFLNSLIAYHTGFGTEAIRTGNAGDHALSMDLAVRLRLASGFAIEPFELLEVLERFGGVEPVTDREVMRDGVEVYQVQTRNPHFHEDRSDRHIDEMQLSALNSIYHSPVCPPQLKDEIEIFVRDGDGLPGDVPPAGERIYPALRTMNPEVFLTVLYREAETFEQVLHLTPRGDRLAPPIPPPHLVEVDTDRLQVPGTTGDVDQTTP